MTTITVTHVDNEVDEFDFDPSQRVITIGRRSTNDVCIPDLSVSGNHAKITLQDGLAWLEDLNSTNGTYVNGHVIFRHAVSSGDDVMMGKVRLGLTMMTSQYAGTAADQADARSGADATAERAQSESDSPSQLDPADHVEPGQADKAGSAPNTAESADSSDEESDLFGDVDSALDNVSMRSNGLAPNGTARAFNSNQRANKSPNAERRHPLDGVEQLVTPDKPEIARVSDSNDAGGSAKGAVIEIKNGAKSGQILPIDKPVTTLGRPGIQIAAIMRKPDGYFIMHIESDDSVDRPTLNLDAIGDEPVLLHSGDKLNVAGIDVEFMLS